MTARDVYERALALIDEAHQDGVSVDTAADYADKAPAVIDVLQRELAQYEGVAVTGEVTDLDDVMQISDDTALRIMPYGLAASFALFDKDGDMHSEYSYMYRSMIRSIRSDEMDMSDVYDVLGGM